MPFIPPAELGDILAHFDKINPPQPPFIPPYLKGGIEEGYKRGIYPHKNRKTQKYLFVV